MIGHQIIQIERVDSTNSYAARLTASQEIEEGTVIRALEQYEGRGQHEHTWHSEPGMNLTCTICLNPTFLPPDQQFRLNKAIALGISDFIAGSLGVPIGGNIPFAITIKWPNDIYAGNLKIAGILIENKIQGGCFASSLVGIGININQKTFPPEVPNPVSFRIILGTNRDINESLSGLCQSLNMRYVQLKNLEDTTIDQEFNRRLLGFNSWRNFQVHDNILEGKVAGVDEFGRLLIEDKMKNLHPFSHPEIQYLF